MKKNKREEGRQAGHEKTNENGKFNDIFFRVPFCRQYDKPGRMEGA